MRKGFTLLELLLTIILMAAGFIFLLQGATVGIFASGENESELIAASLAQEKLEEIRNKSFLNINNEAKALVAGYAPYQREVIVGAPLASLKQVSVKVYWVAKDDELNVTLVTYVSDI